MAKRIAVFAALVGMGIALPGYAVSPDVVISQVYGGGGASSGSPAYKNDYVELFNRGVAAKPIGGYSLQYGSSSGNFGASSSNIYAIPAGTMIQPGGYLLVQLGSAGTLGATVPSPDLTTTNLNLSAASGKVALANVTTALGCGATATPCALPDSRILDLVAYGASNNGEGGTTVNNGVALDNTKGGVRKSGGCAETDNNNADFDVVASPNLVPRNSNSPLSSCTAPTVVATTPADEEGCVPLASDVTVTFSKDVNVDADWFLLTCTSSGVHSAVVTGGPLTFTLNPATDFVKGDTCTATIYATKVHDQDLNDPPDTMSSDFNWTFRPLAATLTPIHDIQGSGDTSPLVGNTVTTRGIVTARKFNNGFFIQAPESEYDADGNNTSEAVFVYTGTPPPSEAAVGNLVEVRGTVAEYPSGPGVPSNTELTSPGVCLISTGNTLPAPIPLSSTFPSPAGAFDQLEKIEGMRVSVGSFTTTARTMAKWVSSSTLTLSSYGEFFGVVTGVARPFREAGIEMPYAVPSGTIPPIPRWDANPELLRVDSDGQDGMSAVDLSSGCRILGLVGPLEFAYGRYTILPDAPVVPVPDTCMAVRPVGAAGADDVTVASFNLRQFSASGLDPTAWATRLGKVSLAIRNYLRSPDIIGVEEVRDQTAIDAIAAKVSADAIANGQPDPLYQGYIYPGNFGSDINVGFLVKTAVVDGSTARVRVNDVVQEGLTATWADPVYGNTSRLNDRPPLRLDATVNFDDDRAFDLQVIVVHQRSLSDVDSTKAKGSTTEGEWVRQKRQAQAVWLANLIRARQDADADEHLIVLGDFNAFEVNDGFADVMGTVIGSPAPADETVVSTDVDGPPIVTPSLTRLVEPLATERYSWVEAGNAQNLDHALVNDGMLTQAMARIQHARIDADFPDVLAAVPDTPERASDHDPLVAYLTMDVDGDGVADSLDPCNDSIAPAFTETSKDQYRVTGTATDCSGIASFALAPGSSNLALEALGNPGDATRGWVARRIVDEQPSSGTIVATDSSTGAVQGTFVVGLDRVLPVPALGAVGLALLVLVVALLGAAALFRRAPLL